MWPIDTLVITPGFLYAWNLWAKHPLLWSFFPFTDISMLMITFLCALSSLTSMLRKETTHSLFLDPLLRFCSIFCNYIQCDILFSLFVAVWKNLPLATILHLLRKHICARLQQCSQFTSRTVSAWNVLASINHPAGVSSCYWFCAYSWTAPVASGFKTLTTVLVYSCLWSNTW